MLLFVGNAAFGGRFYRADVFIQDPFGGVERGLLTFLFAFGELGVGELYVHSVVDRIQLDDVVVLDERDATAFEGFGGDVAHHEAVGATAETAVGDQGHRLAQARADQGGRGFQHLGHAGRAPGSHVTDDHHVAFLDATAGNTLDQLVLPVKYPGGPGEFL